MFSVARSRIALPVQFLFLALNGFGVLFGTVYNINTPDLYENNAHHKVGWVATWVMTAQVIMSLLFTYSRRGKPSASPAGEHATFLPMSVENIAQHNMQPYTDHRWSGDSGQGTERSSTAFNSREASPIGPHRRDTLDDFEKPEPSQPDSEDGDDDRDLQHTQPRFSWLSNKLRINFSAKYLSAQFPSSLSPKILRVAEVLYETVDRTILILGFITLLSGGVTYAGIFVSLYLGPFSGLKFHP